MSTRKKLAIIGAGNIGTVIAKGLRASGRFSEEDMYLTRRKSDLLDPLGDKGFQIGHDNLHAVHNADYILIAVEPRQVDDVLKEIGPELKAGKHLVMSVVSGMFINQIKSIIGEKHTVVRVMPNTAIAICESMTCLAADKTDEHVLQEVENIFNQVGSTLIIDEEQMTASTALGACGIAFFLRAIRAASQGGIEIGFHSEEALTIASQTARGAASLLLSKERHPEHEIDRVTTPRGCTITGLNQMEHAGFSSALIKGITASAEKASGLYKEKDCK
ncbi:pyrroline-5-carboxylate reductase [candidate division KSB1 bacterium]|nr:pyrroline-5-carboxylate reductase [candidate division KSB1 bacterium]